MEMEDRFKWKIVVILVLSLLIVLGMGYLTVLRWQNKKADAEPTAEATVEPIPAESTEPEETAAPEVSTEPTEEPVEEPEETASILDEPDDSYIKLVNKDHPIDSSYVPEDLVYVDVRSDSDEYLRKDAAEALSQLFADAIDQEIYFKLISGYRSYDDQAYLEEYYAGIYGWDAIEGLDCHPGSSEHQLGLAVDLGNWNGQCDLDVCYTWYPTYTFLQEHAHEYGFIERYPEGTSSITGYDDAVWHWRYVGVEEATKIHESGKTMEEYYGITD